MRNPLKYLWPQHEDRALEEKFSRMLKTHAERLNVPQHRILADLRDTLAISDKEDGPDRGPKGGPPSPIVVAEDAAVDDAFPEGDCLDAQEVEQVLSHISLPCERQTHYASCPMCQALVACVTPSADFVRATAQRLASTEAATEEHEARQLREELRREQERAFDAGIEHGPGLEIVRPEITRPVRAARAAWAPSALRVRLVAGVLAGGLVGGLVAATATYAFLSFQPAALYRFDGSQESFAGNDVDRTRVFANFRILDTSGDLEKLVRAETSPTFILVGNISKDAGKPDNMKTMIVERAVSPSLFQSTLGSHMGSVPMDAGAGETGAAPE
jgi:hypothetical protein